MFDQLFAQLNQTMTQLIGQGLGFIFELIWIAASLTWTLMDRMLAYVGAQLELLTHALSTSIFAPLIGQIGGSLTPAVNMSWIIALLILGVCYMLASFGPIRVVTLRSVLSWYVVAVIFLQIGPSLYLTMDNFRGSVQGTFYSTTLTYFQGSNVGSLNVQNTTTGVAALSLSPLCDNFGPYTGNTVGYVNGIDVALAFLRADGYDVIGHLPSFGNVMCATSSPMPVLSSLPRSWYDPHSFFDAAHIPSVSTSDFYTLTTDKQVQVLLDALTGLLRLGAGFLLLIFGMIEQIVAVCLAIAEGLTFISFSVALLFSFFKRTEPIALAMVDQWLALIVQTVIISLLQALIVGFLVALAAGGNPIVAVGVSVVGLVIELLVVKSALSAILKTFDGLFNAFGRATGGAMSSLSSTAGSVVGAGMTLATGGLAGAAMLAGGGTAMQAAGAAFGDSGALTGAVRSLSRLPQGRDTDWGEGAAEFLEGAAFRGIGESVGGRAIGAPVGSYIGGRILSGSETPKEKWGTQKGTGMTDDTRSDSAEVLEGEIVPDDSASDLTSERLPVGVRLLAIATGNTRLGGRGSQPSDLSPHDGDGQDDGYFEGEVPPNGSPRSMRPVEGFFQPSKPLLMIESSATPSPAPDGSPDTAPAGGSTQVGDSVNEGAVSQADADLVNTIDTDEQRLERSGQNSVSSQITAADTDSARLETADESDESHMEGVAEDVAHDEELTMRQAMQTGNTDQSGLTASLLLNASAAQLGVAASAMTQMSQRADVADRRENADRQLANAEGTLAIGGTDNVAAALANLVDSLNQSPSAASGLPGQGQGLPDFMAVSRGMAAVAGLTPIDSITPMAGGQMANIGLFTRQALQMGLDGDSVEQVVRDVKESPDGHLRPETRQALTQRLTSTQGYSEGNAAAPIDTLENYARAIPDTIQVYGARTVAVGPDGSLSVPNVNRVPSSPVLPATSYIAESGARSTPVLFDSAPTPVNNANSATSTPVFSNPEPVSSSPYPQPLSGAPMSPLVWSSVAIPPVTHPPLSPAALRPPSQRNPASMPLPPSAPPFYAADLADLLSDNSGENTQ